MDINKNNKLSWIAGVLAFLSVTDANAAEIQQAFTATPEAEETSIKKTNVDNSTTYDYANFDQSINGPGTSDALSYAIANISYYPDMKEYLTTMVSGFWDKEHKDTTVALLNEMISHIDKPELKVGAIIGALEYSVFYKSTFGDKYGEKIGDSPAFHYIEIFDAKYKAWFKKYYAKLLTKTEELKQRLQESQQKFQESQQKFQESQQKSKNTQQEFEEITAKFSPNDIRTVPGMKKWILYIQQIYLDMQAAYGPNGKEELKISAHMQSLFDAAK